MYPTLEEANKVANRFTKQTRRYYSTIQNPRTGYWSVTSRYSNCRGKYVPY